MPLPGPSAPGRTWPTRALGRRILDRLAGSDGPGFVFAITIEAHGPWTADRFRGFAGQPPTRLDPLSLYLWHLEHMDALFTFLAAGLARLARPAILCGYGDHVPGLPGVGRPGIPEPTATDWFFVGQSGRLRSGSGFAARGAGRSGTGSYQPRLLHGRLK